MCDVITFGSCRSGCNCIIKPMSTVSWNKEESKSIYAVYVIVAVAIVAGIVDVVGFVVVVE